MQKKHSRAYKPRAFPEGYGIFNNQVPDAGARVSRSGQARGPLWPCALCSELRLRGEGPWCSPWDPGWHSVSQESATVAQEGLSVFEWGLLG